ncbi:MAG: ABC transporter permease [Alphaproteobacteria bacterium]|nr:ABC transporter permease [Alphaproteobacteria bacterium]
MVSASPTANLPQQRGRQRARASIRRTTQGFVLLAAACLVFADFELIALDPWGELGKILKGAVTPDLSATSDLPMAVARTIALAVLGVVGAAGVGIALTLVYRFRPVRLVCAFLRNIHELFWALILMQIFGLTGLTGVLALVIPYSCIFAKIYTELLAASDSLPAQSIPGRVGRISRFFYGELPDTRAQLAIYTAYRLECGLRAGTIMGFIGLPTLGFHLETAFTQGAYGQSWAILFVTFGLIATVRVWFRLWTVPLLVLAAFAVLPLSSPIELAHIARLLTVDIVPAPLRSGAGLDGLWAWTVMMFGEQIGPGLANTVIVTQIALVLTGLVGLVALPLASRHFMGPAGRIAGHVALVVLRSTPEYIIAFILLLVWGPSMLPAVVALALHNGAVVGHLAGRVSETLGLRDDAAYGVNLYAFEILPRLYSQFLAFLFYRWEVIFRETAILGILGIHTLGFYADSAIAELRLDRAMLIIVVTGLCGVGIETVSRAIRTRLSLSINIDEAKAS